MSFALGSTDKMDKRGPGLGLAYPFYPWNPERKTSIHVLQIPTMLMYGALLYDQTSSLDQVVESTERLLNKLVAHEGTAALD